MAEPNDEIPKINPSEVETLINKIEQSNLDDQDKRMITRLLRILTPLRYPRQSIDSGLLENLSPQL